MRNSNGYNYFLIYMNVIQHFKQKKFNIFNGSRIKITFKVYDKRKDKPFFERLSNKILRKDFYKFCLANVLSNKKHISEYSMEVFEKWKDDMDKMQYTFNKDCKCLVDEFGTVKKSLIALGGKMPNAIKKVVGGQISYETVCVINKITDGELFDNLNDKIVDRFIFDDVYYKVIKYQYFINKDLEPFKEILIKNLK